MFANRFVNRYFRETVAFSNRYFFQPLLPLTVISFSPLFYHKSSRAGFRHLFSGTRRLPGSVGRCPGGSPAVLSGRRDVGIGNG